MKPQNSRHLVRSFFYISSATFYKLYAHVLICNPESRRLDRRSRGDLDLNWVCVLIAGSSMGYDWVISFIDEDNEMVAQLRPSKKDGARGRDTKTLHYLTITSLHL